MTEADMRLLSARGRAGETPQGESAPRCPSGWLHAVWETSPCSHGMNSQWILQFLFNIGFTRSTGREEHSMDSGPDGNPATVWIRLLGLSLQCMKMTYRKPRAGIRNGNWFLLSESQPMPVRRVCQHWQQLKSGPFARKKKIPKNQRNCCVFTRISMRTS